MWMPEEESDTNSFDNVETVVIEQPDPLLREVPIELSRTTEITEAIKNQSTYGICIKDNCTCKSLLLNTGSKRWAGKRQSEQCNDDWITIEELSLTSATLTSDSVVKDFNNYQEAIDEAHSKLIENKWNPLKAVDSVDINGKFSRVYTCRYIYQADCNCKIRVSHSSSSDNVIVSWWRLGSAHLIPEEIGETFMTKEDHDLFQHIRIPRLLNSLPIEMCELIENTVQVYPNIKPKSMCDLIRDNKSNKGKIWDNIEPSLWVLWKKKINSLMKTEKRHRKNNGVKHLLDNLADIQTWVHNNTYDKVLENKKDDFSIHDLFVAAHVIKADNSLPPLDREERKTWVPKHTCQVVLTSVAMSMFVTKIASKGDIFRAINIASDTTFKLFLFPGFKLHILFVHDATTTAKIIGFEISLTTNGGDYYLLTRACRNVTEYFCRLCKEDLPGGIKELPMNLPSPVPPCTVTSPLTWNYGLKKYEQIKKKNFKTIKSARYSSQKSKHVIGKIYNNLIIFTPELVEENSSQEAQTFCLSLDDQLVVSNSDGDIAIPNGIGAAIPSIGNFHNDCWSHLHRSFVKVKCGKLHSEDQPHIELSRFQTNKSNDLKKQKQDRSDAMKKIYTFCDTFLKQAKFIPNKGLASVIFKDGIEVLRSGRIEGVPFPQPNFADRLNKMFSRITTQGSSGTWRYSDLLYTGKVDITEEYEYTDIKTNAGSVVFGIVDNTCSLEATNKGLKAEFERKPGRVTEVLDGLSEYGRKYTRTEISEYGVSFLPIVYGYGRIHSTRHTEDNRIGMNFLGFDGSSPWLDQRRLIHKLGLGKKLRIFILQGEKELKYLWNQEQKADGHAPIPRPGCKSKLTQVKLWFEKYKKVYQTNGEKLEQMIQTGTKNYIVSLSNMKFKRIADIPINIDKTHKVLYAKSRSAAISEIYDFGNSFAVLTPIIGNFDNIQEEPFRNSFPQDQNVVYKWHCSCSKGLKYGHCEHIFFITHGNNESAVGLGEGYTNIQIPATAMTENLSTPRKIGRPKSMGHSWLKDT